MGQPSAGGAGGDAAGLASFVPLILMFAVFYFLLIRPQQKRTKELKNMLDSLKRGDDVVAAGGIYGRITECTDDYVILDTGDSKLKVARASVSAMVGRGKGEPIPKGKKDSGKSGSGKKGKDGKDGDAEALEASADRAGETETPEASDEKASPAREDSSPDSGAFVDKQGGPTR
jgi:preprotein translocase subunit YajC